MKRFIILIIFIFILIGAGIYLNSLQNGLHYDDRHHIVKNPYIKTLNNIPLFFAEPRTFSTDSTFHNHYRPLLMTSYAINYYLGGFNLHLYHLFNLGFHIGTAFLVFLILQAMLNGGGGKLFIPLTAGLLFLTTPYNTEVVNYISARSTVMCTFFYLMAFYFWVRYREFTPTLTLPRPVAIAFGATGTPGGGNKEGMGRGREGVYYYIASFFAFLLAMLTKEIAITLPVMLWLYDLYFVRTSTGIYGRIRFYLSYLPFAIVGGLIGIVFRMIFFRSIMPDKDIEPLTHLLIEMRVLAKYFIHMAIPINLSVLHLIQETPDIYSFLSIILIFSLLLLSYLLWQSRDYSWRTVSFFIAWFFIVLIPTTFVTLQAPYQENRGYLSGIGFVALTAVGLDSLFKKISNSENKRTMIGYSLITILVIVFSVGVMHRNQAWLNDGTLWSDVLKKYPESTGAHLGLGNYYIINKQLDKAEGEFRAILNINPEDPRGLISLGIIYFIKGERDKAEEFFTRALEIAPLDDSANFFMARILQARGDLPQATKHLLRVLAVKPDNLDVSVGLITLYSRMGRLDEAYDRMKGALEKDPDNPAIRRALGLIYMSRGKWEEASREFEIVLKYMPDDPKTLADYRTSQLRAGIKQ